MKAGLALASRCLGYERRFIAGVHDTDYFAKLPGQRGKGGYAAVGHNDASTRDLWSAAGEFSTLFGSETVVTRDLLAQGGLKLGKILRHKPDILEKATEAWGWRGVIAREGEPRVSAETPLGPLLNVLCQTLDWAVDETLACVASKDRTLSEQRAERLHTILCDSADDEDMLGPFYRRILPELYSFAASEPVDIETTATSELLRLNRGTASLPRFEILEKFVAPATRVQAADAYNTAIAGTEMYEIERFGTGAIPFDLVVPGRGRGTVRLAHRAIVVMTPRPIFIDLKRPVTSVAELAAAIEGKLGPDCTLVGKAVSLIGMLAREFVLVFHHGASGYVGSSRELIRRLGMSDRVNPILRIKYSPWDALAEVKTWLRLPEPFNVVFGADEICSPSFAARWREVVESRRRLIADLAQMKRPVDLIRFLGQRDSGSWNELAREYEQLRQELDALRARLAEIRMAKAEALAQMKAAKQRRVAAEIASGEHWRAELFERPAKPGAQAERMRLRAAIDDATHAVDEARRRWRELQAEQDAAIRAEPILRVHERRRNLELEAELKRLSLIRKSVIAAYGLPKAGYRPSSWWFPIVDPSGAWFRETTCRAEYSVEPLG